MEIAGSPGATEVKVARRDRLPQPARWVRWQAKLGGVAPELVHLLAPQRLRRRAAPRVLAHEGKRLRETPEHVVRLVSIRWRTLPPERLGKLVVDELLVQQAIVV
jgi:hypothetical protein